MRRGGFWEEVDEFVRGGGVCLLLIFWARDRLAMAGVGVPSVVIERLTVAGVGLFSIDGEAASGTTGLAMAAAKI